MGKKKITIADDDVLLARMIEICLSQRGHQVKTVVTGLDAVKSFFQDKPDLLVLDIGLPDCSGWFLARLLARLETGSKLPIILMSTLDPDRGQLAEARPFAYIQKPFDIGQLIDIIENELNEEVSPPLCIAYQMTPLAGDKS